MQWRFKRCVDLPSVILRILLPCVLTTIRPTKWLRLAEEWEVTKMIDKGVIPVFERDFFALRNMG